MECMSFSRLFMAISLILVYVIQKLVVLAHQASPSPDCRPTVQFLLAAVMVIMILVSVLSAYMEAMLYLRSQQAPTAQATINHNATIQSNHHNSNGGSNNNNNISSNGTSISNKDFHHPNNHERNNCSNQHHHHSGDTCNKDRTSGHGAASAISATISHQQQQSSSLSSSSSSTTSSSSSPASSIQFQNGLTQLANGKSGGNSSNNSNMSKHNNNKSNNNCTQKRRKNSSTANSEKVPTNSNKSIGSTSSDKKSSSLYAPIFQNLTNVIASPPPPLPTFDNEFDSLEFKRLRGKKSAKKSNSLNGSIAGSDDVANPSSLVQGGIVSSSVQAAAAAAAAATAVVAAATSVASGSGNKIATAVSPKNGVANGVTNNCGKMTTNGLKSSGEVNCNERDTDFQAQLKDQTSPLRSNSQNKNKDNLKMDVFTSTSMLDNEEPSSCPKKTKLYNGVDVDVTSNQQDQPAVLPIQPPSSSSSSSAASTSSSSPSSTSSSPPLSASSYGEYSLLGPGATFELPCLRVRSK